MKWLHGWGSLELLEITVGFLVFMCSHPPDHRPHTSGGGAAGPLPLSVTWLSNDGCSASCLFES
eukprot:gene5889-5792_t